MLNPEERYNCLYMNTHDILIVSLLSQVPCLSNGDRIRLQWEVHVTP